MINAAAFSYTTLNDINNAKRYIYILLTVKYSYACFNMKTFISIISIIVFCIERKILLKYLKI